MATLVADPGTELVFATERATLVGEIVDLLVEAKESIMTAQELVHRLSLEKRLDEVGLAPQLVADFLSAARSVDPYAIDGEHLYPLLRVLVEEQRVLQQDINDAMNSIEDGVPDAG